MKITCTTGLSQEEDIASDNAEVRVNGIKALKKAIEITSIMGSSILTGVIHCAWGISKSNGKNKQDKYKYSSDSITEITSILENNKIKLGIEPLNRGKNEGHKILRFPILRASVKAYKNNLKTHKGYSEFREKRHNIRKRNKTIKGLDLTDTLDRYAQTGKKYTDILEQIIKQNDLSDFETVRLTNSVVKKDIQL